MSPWRPPAAPSGTKFFQGTTSYLDIWNLGATYDFGVVKLFGEYSHNKTKTRLLRHPAAAQCLRFHSPGASGALVGATVPVGPGLIAPSTQVENF